MCLCNIYIYVYKLINHNACMHIHVYIYNTCLFTCIKYTCLFPAYTSLKDILEHLSGAVVDVDSDKDYDMEDQASL